MTSSTRRGARRGLGLLACSMIWVAGPTAAQERWQTSPPADPYQRQPAPPPPDSATELRRNLATVGTSPNNVAALVDSGRAALAMGDAQAALTFFSRADEISPRDARIKAGMASAMTMLGQPRPALTLFAEAQGLGAPDIEIASDRGLAHDLLGDPRAAQRDYALVLRQRDNDETRRRLALSLAISGQREPALRLLEPQTRRNDRAGWRTQAFVLALTGDAAGAARVAAGAGPIGTAEAMAPFLGRLPALSPAQRAMAVHLGVFPSDGRAQYAANVDTTPDPGALALAGGPPRPPAPPATEPARRDARPGLRRRPPADSPVQRAAVSTPRPREQIAAAERPRTSLQPYVVPGPNGEVRTRVARMEPRRPTAPDTVPPATPAPDPYRFAASPAEPSASSPTQQPAARPSVSETRLPPARESAPAPPAIDSAILAGVRPGDMVAAPGFSLTPQPGPPPPPVSERGNSALGDIAMVVNALPQDQGAAPLASAARPPAPPVQRSAAPPPPSPGRHWVQIAGGIERASMAGELRRLRGRAPALLNEMQGWTAQAGGTRLLLVGPFGSARDAQAFVNQLRPRGVEAVAWASASGQAVERVSGPAASTARAAPQRRAGTRTEAQRPVAGTRSARGRGEEARPAPGARGTRGRGEESRATAARGSRGREESRPAADARRGRAEPARSGSSRNARAADTRSNRGGSTVERRANDRDARPSRSRSGEEQRSSSRRGRAG